VRAHVIGLGQGAAGDDSVGLVVLRSLRERALPSGIELHEFGEPSALVPLLSGDTPVIVVDAVLGDPAGAVVELSPDELGAHAPLRLSSHGLGVAEAIGLARVLAEGRSPPEIRIVAVTIARPERYQQGLSPEVAAAVPRAVKRVLSLVNHNCRSAKGLRK
jgi:hydrogenase maturation protease